MRSTDEHTIAWKAWYDGATAEPVIYTSERSTLEALPADGFQAMRLWYHDGTGRVISGNDWYFFYEHADGTLAFCQSNDAIGELRARYPGAIFKRGRHTSERLNQRIHESVNGAKCASCG